VLGISAGNWGENGEEGWRTVQGGWGFNKCNYASTLLWTSTMLAYPIPIMVLAYYWILKKVAGKVGGNVYVLYCLSNWVNICPDADLNMAEPSACMCGCENFIMGNPWAEARCHSSAHVKAGIG
jgi:hypothetical protein